MIDAPKFWIENPVVHLSRYTTTGPLWNIQHLHLINYALIE
jgi:hypothetical protein